MKIKSIFLASAIGLCGVIGFTSCKKKGCTDSEATNYNSVANEDDGSCIYDVVASAAQPAGYSPSFSGTFGTLVAIKTISTTTSPIGPIETQLGTAVAVFSEDGGGSFISAGTVDVDGNSLTSQSNNSYVYTPGTSNPTGISFGGTVNWTGSGSTWPSFNASTTDGFSTVAEISSGDVSTGSSYTATSGSVTNADSTYFGIYGPDGSVFYIVGGGTNSYTFSAADLSTVGVGQGYVQIIGLNYDPQNIGGRDYWLINETVRTKSVNLN